jgi:two-component system, NarL family, sensor kinase
LLSSIYPVSVPPEGWVAGLDDLVASLRRLGVDVTLDVVDTPLGEVEQLLLLRVAREALRNVSAHAAATRVTVRLRRRGDRLELTVSDDGRGFDASQDRSGHFGLTLIEDLIDEAGGTLETVSEVGAGTTVRCDLVVVS